jgi:SAM-dependent methyltransferase
VNFPRKTAPKKPGQAPPEGPGWVHDWLATPLGRRYIANEQRAVRVALDRVFGEQLLQIGVWGHPQTFLRHARTQHSGLVSLCDGQAGPGIVRLHGPVDPADTAGAHLIGDPEELPVADGSVDAVLLPHTLEITASPHALLREVDRILRADGQLLTLSFMPAGVWGLRSMLSRGGYPPGRRRMIGEGRLRDWLKLLSFEAGDPVHYCYSLPLERKRRAGRWPSEAFAQRWLPMLAGGYLLCAHKRVRPLTPLKPAWRRERLRAVGGLVKPTTRTGTSHSRRRG